MMLASVLRMRLLISRDCGAYYSMSAMPPIATKLPQRSEMTPMCQLYLQLSRALAATWGHWQRDQCALRR